jgi:transposase
MPPRNDLSRSLSAFEQDCPLIVVLEISFSTWLVAGLVPGVVRQPLKKLGADEHELLKLVCRWREEASRAGCEINRICVTYEAGRDGFWLARWLKAQGMEAYVIHSASVAVSREHRRAKTDRLDTELLKRAFLGWLRSEPGHCSMAAVPTIEEEDARRPSREREKLVGDRTWIINRMKAALVRFASAASSRPCARPRKVWMRFARLKDVPSRRTRARSCAATWRGCGSCRIRSRRSRKTVCAGSKQPLKTRQGHLRWSG